MPQAGGKVEATAITVPDTTRRLWSRQGLINVLKGPRIISFLWLTAIVHLAGLIVRLPGRVGHFDISIFYASAVAMRGGLNPYITDLSRIGDPLGLEIRPLIHTTSMPTFLFLFAPFAHVSEPACYWIWFAINVASLAAAMVLLIRGTELDSWLKSVLAVMMLLYTPLDDQIAYAQAQILILLMLVLIMRWLARGNDAGAGLLLALAAALRAYPAVLVLYLLIRRRWRALAATVAGSIVIGLITIAGIGWPLTQSGLVTIAGVGGPPALRYLSSANLQNSYRSMADPINVAVSAFVTRLFWDSFGIGLSRRLDLLRLATVACTQLAILWLSIKATWRSLPLDELDCAFGLWVVTAIILSPLAWIHYMVLLFIPFMQIAVAAYRGRCGSGVLWMALASYLILPISVALREPAARWGGLIFYRFVSESVFLSLLLAYAAAYRLTVEAGRREVSLRLQVETATAST
jgi:hypothetical protein